ncbi:hypothetical protein ACE1SV_49210 [Streptomyces sp. E-15]
MTCRRFGDHRGAPDGGGRGARRDRGPRGRRRRADRTANPGPPRRLGDYAGGPAPGLSFRTAGRLHRTEIAAIATDTWGFGVRPNEFEHAFQPLHQVAIPNIGLLIGEMWDPDALAEDCAADGVYEFQLTAAPCPSAGQSAPPSIRSPSNNLQSKGVFI